MKFTIVMLSLIVSTNVFAFAEVSLQSQMSSVTTLILTSGPVHKVQAAAVINDAQEMLQTGAVSLFLSQKIQEVQSQNAGLSEAEALDILIESAQSALSN